MDPKSTKETLPEVACCPPTMLVMYCLECGRSTEWKLVSAPAWSIGTTVKRRLSSYVYACQECECFCDTNQPPNLHETCGS